MLIKECVTHVEGSPFLSFILSLCRRSQRGQFIMRGGGANVKTCARTLDQNSLLLSSLLLCFIMLQTKRCEMKKEASFCELLFVFVTLFSADNKRVVILLSLEVFFSQLQR